MDRYTEDYELVVSAFNSLPKMNSLDLYVYNIKDDKTKIEPTVLIRVTRENITELISDLNNFLNTEGDK